jgi:hypothetical protein
MTRIIDWTKSEAFNSSKIGKKYSHFKAYHIDSIKNAVCAVVGGINQISYSSNCRLAKFRGLMVKGKYDAVIGLR